MGGCELFPLCLPGPTNRRKAEEQQLSPWGAGATGAGAVLAFCRGVKGEDLGFTDSW